MFNFLFNRFRDFNSLVDINKSTNSIVYRCLNCREPVKEFEGMHKLKSSGLELFICFECRYKKNFTIEVKEGK